MRIRIPKESQIDERRVAATPDSVKKLIALGFEVGVERGAGDAACFPDVAYEASGAKIVEDPWHDAELLLKVRPPQLRPDGVHEADLLPDGATLVSFVWPARNQELLDRLAVRHVTLLAMDQIPRISRAQKMDALSSMANISGYRAIIEAASHFGSFFTGQMTAAGKVAPAKVLVIGAGVAGLSALGTAKSLGAIVRAFDTRAAVRDQVKSMGAEFLEVKIEEEGEGGGGYAKEMSPAYIAAEFELFRQQAREIDIVVTTALIPGKPAPKLWLADMVELMKPGSVVVDLAAEAGGNCDLTVPDEVIVHPLPGVNGAESKGGVTIIGRTDLTSRLATTASQLFSNNLVHLLTDMTPAAGFSVDLTDEVVRGALVLHHGALTWPPPKPAQAAAETAKSAATASTDVQHAPRAPMRTTTLKFSQETLANAHQVPGAGHVSARKAPLTWVMMSVLVVAWLALHFYATHDADTASQATQLFAERLTVFMLACFVGWQVVWNVTPALHTPLMSVTNAISGIILLGGMLHTIGNVSDPPVILGVVAVLLATINVSGGFLVTRRMLRMFRK